MAGSENTAAPDYEETRQAKLIQSVPPSELVRKEHWFFVIWPSIGMYPLGRLIGQIISCSWGWPPFTIGNLLALLLAPVAATLYLAKYFPGQLQLYIVTSRRVLKVRGYKLQIVRSIGYDSWNRVEVIYRPGQRALRCADLVFFADDREVLRLPGVPQPEAYRHAISQIRETLAAFAPLCKGE
ncbi:MAG: hypothetical protein NZ899_14680 [Thermoguttaceae bacterium]|nr:hypothetical protein [Thermoguttaceae bacterium]MDW8079560.1 hypothetical protein [Thermoguttaceae bacterium]